MDGQGVQRFDGIEGVDGQRTEITYGRHVISLQVSAPAVVTHLTVFVRGGLVREVIETAARRVTAGGPAKRSAEERLADLEQRVTRLEAEVKALKRRNP